jgi:hypothetical protein
LATRPTERAALHLLRVRQFVTCVASIRRGTIIFLLVLVLVVPIAALI